MEIQTVRFCESCDQPTAETEYHSDRACGFPLHKYTTQVVVRIT